MKHPMQDEIDKAKRGEANARKLAESSDIPEKWLEIAEKCKVRAEELEKLQ